MATKATKATKKKAMGSKKAASAAKPKSTARRAPAKAKVGAKGATRATSKVKRATRATSKARSAAKGKAEVRRALKARNEPETLRLKDLSFGVTVNDLARSIHFYVEALGCIVKHRWERDGQLRGVQLAAGRCEISVGQDDWGKGRDRVKGVGFRIYAETAQDLGKLAARIREHGFAAEGPRVEGWGATTVNVEDPDGFKITFHSPMD
jgi:catechol 2,3-dioxygenase-like lactoylglutathione lyase family enzyme